MNPIWNRRQLQPPPLCSIPIGRSELADTCIKHMKHTFKYAIINYEENLSLIRVEMQVLKRVLYKGNNQFRYDKFHKHLTQIRKCLYRLFEVNLQDTISAITDIIQSVELKDEKVFLPCKQYGNYLLVRIVGVAALLAQTTDHCTTTYLHILEQMKLGFFIPGALFISALMSRLWVLCRLIIITLGELYCHVVPIIKTFPSSEADWLISDELLPVNLKIFLCGISRSPLDKRNWPKGSTRDAFNLQENQVDCGPDIGEIVTRSEYEQLTKEKESKGYDEFHKNRKSLTSRRTKLLDKNTTKVMDKVHNFLADEVGEPFSSKPRMKSALEKQTEHLTDLMGVNCEKWERKLMKCKSILMVRNTLNKLRKSIGTKYKIRGLLKTIKMINQLSANSGSCDVSGARIIALKLIRKLRKNGLSTRTVNTTGERGRFKPTKTKHLSESSVCGDPLRKEKCPTVCVKNETTVNDMVNVDSDESTIVIPVGKDISSHISSIMKARGARHIFKKLNHNRCVLVVENITIVLDDAIKIKLKKQIKTCMRKEKTGERSKVQKCRSRACNTFAHFIVETKSKPSSPNSVQ